MGIYPAGPTPGDRIQLIKDGVAVALAPAPEADVVDNDPALALLSAQSDGLLTYRGFVSGGRYEIVAAGRHWATPAAGALLTVARLRAIERLRVSGALLELVEIRDDGAYAIQTSQGMLVLPEQEVIHWCAGYAAGMDGNGQPHAGVNTIGKIADLFEAPSLDDQARMVILGLMYGGPKRITAPDLVEMIGQLPGIEEPPVKKTITNALTFGNYISSDVVEMMIRAFGLRWVLSASRIEGAPALVRAGEPLAGLADEDAARARRRGEALDRRRRARGGPPAAEPATLPEMPGLVRLRALAAAARKGWLRYLDKESPTDARRLRDYRVSVGEQTMTIPGEALLPWLRGLQSWHETAG